LTSNNLTGRHQSAERVNRKSKLAGCGTEPGQSETLNLNVNMCVEHHACGHCRLPWGEGLLGLAPTQEERSAVTGQLLFRGLSARVGIFHGPIVKLCPHSTTGMRHTVLLAYHQPCCLQQLCMCVCEHVSWCMRMQMCMCSCICVSVCVSVCVC